MAAAQLAELATMIKQREGIDFPNMPPEIVAKFILLVSQLVDAEAAREASGRGVVQIMARTGNEAVGNI